LYEFISSMHATRTVRLVPKDHPRTDQEGPKGKYSHSCTLSLNLALDEDGCSTSRPCHFTPAKTRYPLYRRLSGPLRPSGRVRGISPPTGLRLPDRPDCGKSIYQLSYPDASV
jgi:hypothetical protein